MMALGSLRGLLLALLISMAGVSAASAQTISQPNGDNNLGNAGSGQSFTATATGTVTQIQVRGRQNIATTLRFYNGGAGSGVINNQGAAAYTQAVNIVDQGSDAAGFQTITLTTPFPVVTGSQYTFLFDAGNYAYQTANPYAGGTLLYDYANPGNGSLDLSFAVLQVVPAPVPTMTEWAMIMLALILAGSGALYLQRRRQIG